MPREEPAIGKITWMALDGATGTRLANGVIVVSLRDVNITPRRNTLGSQRSTAIFLRLTEEINPEHMPDPGLMKKIVETGEAECEAERLNSKEDWNAEAGPVWYIKKIRLDELFSVSMTEHPSDDLSGFGLTGGRADMEVFSWEWFNVTGAEVAVKLQETGTLRFRTAETPSGIEMVYTKFETDVSLRLSPMGHSNVVTKPVWRINIRAGSEVHWPSLIDGTIVANGHLP